MKIAILGAGAWGTALAIHAAQRHDVMLWSRNAQVLESLRTAGTNQRYLPDVKVPSSMGFTDRLDEAVRDADLLVMATSVAGLEPVAQAVQALQPGDGSALPGVVCLAKGLQASTGRHSGGAGRGSWRSSSSPSALCSRGPSPRWPAWAPGTGRPSWPRRSRWPCWCP